MMPTTIDWEAKRFSEERWLNTSPPPAVASVAVDLSIYMCLPSYEYALQPLRA